RNEYEPAPRLAAVERREPHLRLVLPVQLDLLVVEPQLGGDVGDRAELRRLGDGDVGGNGGSGGSRGRHGHGASPGESVASSRGPKTRRAFSVVRSPRASGDSPRRPASAAATSSSASRACTTTGLPSSAASASCAANARRCASRGEWS